MNSYQTLQRETRSQTDNKYTMNETTGGEACNPILQIKTMGRPDLQEEKKRVGG